MNQFPDMTQDTGGNLSGAHGTRFKTRGPQEGLLISACAADTHAYALTVLANFIAP